MGDRVVERGKRKDKKREKEGRKKREREGLCDGNYFLSRLLKREREGERWEEEEVGRERSTRRGE